MEILFIKDYRVDLDHPLIKTLNEKQLNEFKSLLPTQTEKTMAFNIHDVNIGVANGLRRYLIGGYDLKALSYHKYEIFTNDPYIIEEDLYDRISFIPLDQNCPDITFSLSYVNNSDQDVVVLSGEIESSDGKDYFNQNLPLAVLEPKKYLAVENISIDIGKNYQHAKFSAVSNIIWKPVDYVDVDIMYKKNIKCQRVLLEDLIKLTKKHKTKWPSRTLIVPDKQYELLHNMEEIVQEYEFIIEDDIKVRQSTNSNPRSFYCEFTTNGNIEPQTLVKSYFTDTSNQLLEIKENLLMCLEQNIDIAGNIAIDYEGEKTIVTVLGHTHTISNILRHYIYQLDQNIPFLTTSMNHISDRAFNLNLIHSNPLQITIDAIDICIKDLQSLGDF